MDSIDPFKRSNCTPRTPNKGCLVRSQSDSVVDTPGKKRQIIWSPDLDHMVKKPNLEEADNIDILSETVNNDSAAGNDIIYSDKNDNHIEEVISKDPEASKSCWDNTASFAAVVKSNESLQVAFYTDPQMPFTSEDRLDFIDAMGDLIVNSDDVPCFESTVCRGNFLIVTAENEFSFEWLLSYAVNIEIGKGSCLKVMPASQIPKLKKIVLWLPGRKRLPEAEMLFRLGKANPTMSCSEWRVFSRKDEVHGCRLLIGVDEATFAKLQAVNMKPYWSTVRGQVTPVDDMKAVNVERSKRLVRAKARKFGKETQIISGKPMEANKPGKTYLSQPVGGTNSPGKGTDTSLLNSKQSEVGKLSTPARRRNLAKPSKNIAGKITSYLKKSSPSAGSASQQCNFENTNRFNVLQDLLPEDEDSEITTSVADKREVFPGHLSSHSQQ